MKCGFTNVNKIELEETYIPFLIISLRQSLCTLWEHGRTLHPVNASCGKR